MADGPGSVNSGGDNGGPLGKLVGTLENRLVLVVLAAGLGIGGNLAIVSNEPTVRADPYTGTEGRALTARVDQLERAQALDNAHRQDAVEGYQRIRELERRCVINYERIDALRRDLDRMK